MLTLHELFNLSGSQQGRFLLCKQMVSTINSFANSISPDHDSLVQSLREEFNDTEITLATLTDEQVGKYFLPIDTQNTDAIATWQLILSRWDRLYHEVTDSANMMPPLDI